MLAVILKFLSGVSLKTWLWVGVVSALGIWHWHAVHAAYSEGVAEATAKLQPKIDHALADLADADRGRSEALSANATNQATIATLRGSVASCESGRLADQAAQARAMAERARAVTVAQAAAAKARSDLDALISEGGRCRLWAQQPACGVVP